MKRLLLIVTLPLLAKTQKVPNYRGEAFEEDMNSIPMVMDEKLYTMSCADIKKNTLAIKVLRDEMHTYMMRTDHLALRIKALEEKAARKPWYKRLFHIH